MTVRLKRVTVEVELSSGRPLSLSFVVFNDTDEDVVETLRRGLAILGDQHAAMLAAAAAPPRLLGSAGRARPEPRFIHALTTEGNPKVPLCGGKAEDKDTAIRTVGRGLLAAVDCPDCLRATSRLLVWSDWRAAVQRLLVARHNTTARKYKLVQITPANVERWKERWKNGATPEEAVNARLWGR